MSSADVLDEPRTEQGMEVSLVERHEMVAVAAYFCAERRDFEPGHEREDWYEAEADIDAMLEGMRRAGVTRRDYERVGLRNALRLWSD